MCEPFSAVACLFCWMYFLRKLHNRAQKWPEYEKALKEAAAFISALESDHRRLLDTKIILEFAELGNQIALGKDLLEKARKLVDWEKQTSHEQMRSAEFAFKYKTAIDNQRRLETCLGSLKGPREQIDMLKRNLEARNAYLRQKRRGTCAALARQYIRREMVYAPSIFATQVVRPSHLKEVVLRHLTLLIVVDGNKRDGLFHLASRLIHLLGPHFREYT